jgi:hypothetical protein
MPNTGKILPVLGNSKYNDLLMETAALSTSIRI